MPPPRAGLASSRRMAKAGIFPSWVENFAPTAAVSGDDPGTATCSRVPDISQPEVKQGGSFTYDFVVRDAGLYWYHPHVMSAAQVGFGLYGALLVEDPEDGVGVTDRVTIVLSDIGFDAKGRLEPADSGGSAGMVFGREGDYLLVNGRSRPVLRARSGAPQRWRIVNAAKSRFFYLDLEGQAFTVIGVDGGLQERPVTSDILLVTPGERVDVIVAPKGKAGTPLTLRAMLYNRGYGSVQYRSVEDVMFVEFTADPPVTAPPVRVSRAMPLPQVEGATPVDVVLTLPPMENNKSEFRVNGVPFWKAKPFHLHGFFFQIIDERPGEWMFHCHILDHADGGLMGTVLVGPVGPTKHEHPRKP